MQITWDKPKRVANLVKHGLDFADLNISFFEKALVVRARDGRLKAVGCFAVSTIAVVFAPFGREAIAVISMRPASAAEREKVMNEKGRVAGFEPGRGYSQDDWDAVSDNPEWTEEEFAQAKSFAEVLPELAESIRRSRGRPALEQPKAHVSLRLDADVVAKFKATGKGWQSRINEVLKQAKV